MTQTLLSSQNNLPQAIQRSDHALFEPLETPVEGEGYPRPGGEGILTLARPLRPARPKAPVEPPGPQSPKELKNWIQSELEQLSKRLSACQGPENQDLSQDWVETQRRLGSILRNAEVMAIRVRS